MNKAELIKHLAEQADVTQKQAESVLNALIATIQDTVRAGGELALTDLGKFSAKQRDAKMGRNPATGAAMEIPAKRVPQFSAAKALKDAAASNGA